MPGLPFKQLSATMPGREQTPFTILDGELKSTQDFYTEQETKFKRTKMTDRDFANVIGDLQARYDKDKQRIVQKRNQLKMIQKLVNQGHIPPDTGQQAMWRMVLPQETEQAMFPRQEVKTAGPQPFSPGQLQSYLPSIEEFAQAAKTIPAFFTRRSKEQRTQPELLKQYQGWKEFIDYDNLSPGRKRQVDIQWDDYMDKRGFYEWDKNSMEVKSLRASGPLQRAVSRQVTPLAQSVMAAKPGKQIDMETAKKILAEVGGDKTKARELARQRGYKL